MPESDLALLVRAAEAAADVALRHFKRAPRVWDKPDDSPVTEADLEVDALLKALLTQARPDYGWLSEETPDDQSRLARTRSFIVDPIDGTRSFIEGGNSWCHSLAIVEEGRPIAGVVLQPIRDRLYSASAGGGAYLGDSALPGSAALGDPPVVLATRSTMAPEHWPGGQLALDRSYRPSLAYRMALVAEGRFDAMLTLRPTWDWDVAAGALLITEAGHEVSDRSGKPLRFNGPNARSNGIVAANTALHSELLKGLGD